MKEMKKQGGMEGGKDGGERKKLKDKVKMGREEK